MSRSRLSLILLTLFLVQLFAGFGEARGFVWCIGAGGEARLENLPQGHCDSAEPCTDERGGEVEGDRHGFAAQELEHCGDCLDLPALSASFRHSPRFSPDADLTPVLFPVLPASSFSPLAILEAPAGFHPQPPPSDSPHLVSLRTVILRN